MVTSVSQFLIWNYDKERKITKIGVFSVAFDVILGVEHMQ